MIHIHYSRNYIQSGNSYIFKIVICFCKCLYCIALYNCDNVRLYLMQDRCRAHVMHILNWKQRETQQNVQQTFITANTSHTKLDISQFLLQNLSQMSQNWVSHITHYAVTLTVWTTARTTVNQPVSTTDEPDAKQPVSGVEKPGWYTTTTIEWQRLEIIAF